ncbi:hypothetical protein GIB67_036918 [Kingdonia uniflora]|uniref:Piwi domain-containing protein n=1 Tax=Kingdonia uniflora TaxID=39325 RepID=A0A7J7NW22_9MAGN|nr:hypothetical protein GIB67_036918 [Kingdonia uniflora]
MRNPYPFFRSSLVEKSRQKPKESLSVLSDTLKTGKYDDDQMLKSCGIKTDLKFTQVKGRVLSDPKLGGLNSMLTTEHGLNISMISKALAMMLGMDVSHGSPGQADVPSISVMVSSRQWSSFSRYRACVRTLSPKVEMVLALFKRDCNTMDAGIIR